MGNYKYSIFDKGAEARAMRGGFIENLYYETKPVLMLAIAGLSFNNIYATSVTAKLCIGVLTAAALYILYRRLEYRGYIK